MIKIGDPQFAGRPPKPGIVLVRFRGDPDELFCWHDGTSYSHGHPDVIGARGDKPLLGRLGDSRVERREVEYWRSYEAKASLVDLLRAAMAKLRGQ